MYLDYDSYADMGGGASESAFSRFEAKARLQINRATFGRIENEKPVRESVKNCMYELIEAMSDGESAGRMATGREITSMSNDGMSVSFSSGSGARAASARYAAIIREWLSAEVDKNGTPLLYAGVIAG